MIVISIVVEVEPPVLLAHIVYVVCVMFTLGVPEIIPSENVKPDGRDGLVSHVATFPPASVGIMLVILTPRVNTTVEGE